MVFNSSVVPFFMLWLPKISGSSIVNPYYMEGIVSKIVRNIIVIALISITFYHFLITIISITKL